MAKAAKETKSTLDRMDWGQPALPQVAALLVHLASPAASNISGAVIPVLGGDL